MSRRNRPETRQARENAPGRDFVRAAAKTPAEASCGRNPGISGDAPPPSMPLHTPEMQDAELREMLGGTLSGGAITAGQLMALWLERSPYLVGGVPTPDADAALLRLTRCASIPEAVAALDTALRPLCIIRTPSGSRTPPCYDGYGPEWLADLVAAAARALPSLTWSDAMWRTPLCLLGHLAGAAVRAVGGRTERPLDTTAADDWLLRANGLKK